jgi:hypothetical protein
MECWNIEEMAYFVAASCQDPNLKHVLADDTLVFDVHLLVLSSEVY